MGRKEFSVVAGLVPATLRLPDFRLPFTLRLPDFRLPLRLPPFFLSLVPFCCSRVLYAAAVQRLYLYRIAVAVIAAAIAFFLVRLHSVFSYGTHRNFFKIIKKYFT